MESTTNWLSTLSIAVRRCLLLQFTTHRSLLLFLFILLIVTNSPCTNDPEYRETPFQDGEVLHYSVKWCGIKLGTVEICQANPGQQDSSTYLLTMTIRSNPKIPLTDICIIDKGILSAASPTNIHFTQDLGEDAESRIIYEYDRESQSILKESRKNEIIKRQHTMSYSGPYYDALGVIMMIRGLSKSNAKVSLQALSEFCLRKLDIRFTNTKEEMKTGCMNTAVQVRRFEGYANWVEKSCAGLTGPFEGWVSDDDAAVPLKVRVKICVGSVHLELEDIERRGWAAQDSSSVQNPALIGEEKE